jgi:seryl-tRNA synthetase
MPGFMDKLKQAAGEVADATKKGAASAQTKAKVHGLRGKADEAAQKLGYLVYRERTGGEAAGAEADELVSQIGDLEHQISEAEAGAAEAEAAEDEAEAVAPETPQPPAPEGEAPAT